MSEQEKSLRPDLLADARSFFRGRVLVAAVRLGIAEHLDKTRHVEELAELAECDPSSLLRLLRALASTGVVELRSDGTVSLTPEGEVLRRGHPESIWASVIFWGDLLADNWSHLPECVRAGETAWKVVERTGEMLRFAREPEGGSIFHGAMAAGNGEAAHRPIVDAYPFETARTVADLGGGGGGLLAAILLRHPEIHGTLVDLEGAVDGARERLAAAGVDARCQIVAHDLSESVPVDADLYILKHVLHAGTEDEVLPILRNVRRRIREDSKLLVVEVSLPSEVTSPDMDAERAAMLDLTMLVMTGGRERDEAQWSELLARGGFAVTRIVPVQPAGLTIFEAAPV